MQCIKSLADIRAVEAQGFDALCPYASPQKIIEASAARWPDATALHYLVNADDPSLDRRWSYSELRADVTAAARAFRKLGVFPDRSVAILANHTPIAQIALWGAGVAGRAAPINPLLRPAHIAALLKASNAALVIVMGVNEEQDYWSELVPALRSLGVDLPILDCDSDTASPGSDGALEALLANERGRELGFDVHGNDDSVVALYHTGGTTGTPKLVQHTRRNEAHVARSCALLHALEPCDVVLNGFPLFHVAGGFVFGLSSLSAGSTVLIPGRLGMRNQKFVSSFWRQAERHGTTVMGAVPTTMSGVMGIPVDANIARIRVALTGGAPLPTELAAKFERQIGIPVRNIFGMTESAGGIAMESVHAARTPLCCGLPLPFTEVVILEHGGGTPNLSRKLEAGETGIVAVRGPNVSPGYTDDSLNEGTFLDGGWLLTGDLGRIDDEGRVYLTGRAKDVIIRGSHNIDPQSIEDALMAHPDVESVAAVGMPDSYAGELPVVFISLRPGASASHRDLLAFLETRIEEPAAMPKRAEIIEQMPLTPIGKIFKPALRARAIGWAVDAAAKTAGAPDGSYSFEVNDKLEVTVSVDADRAQALEDAVVGMPIAITFTPR